MLIEKKILIYGVIISTENGCVTFQGFIIALTSEVFRICVNENSFGMVVNLYENDTMNLQLGAFIA